VFGIIGTAGGRAGSGSAANTCAVRRGDAATTYRNAARAFANRASYNAYAAT
jgi:hypothetical protein